VSTTLGRTASSSETSLPRTELVFRRASVFLSFTRLHVPPSRTSVEAYMELNRNFKWTKNKPVQSSDSWRQSSGYQKSTTRGRICWRGMFWAWSEWKSGGVMDTESGDDDKDELTNEWQGELRPDWWGLFWASVANYC